MGEWQTGKGKYGLKILHKDGSVERAWYTTESMRDKVYKNMKTEPNIKTINKIKRK